MDSSFVSNDLQIPFPFSLIDKDDKHPFFGVDDIPFFLGALRCFEPLRRRALFIILVSGVLSFLENYESPKLPFIINFSKHHGEDAHHFIAMILELLAMLDIVPSLEDWQFYYLGKSIKLNFNSSIRRNVNYNAIAHFNFDFNFSD